MKEISVRLWALFVGLFVVVFATSFLVNRFEVEGKLRNYVSLWEVDISKSMMVHQDKTLMDKILKQLRYVEASVQRAEALVEGQGEQTPILTQIQSLFRIEIPVSLHLIPVGYIQIDLAPEGVMVRTLTSFLFLSGVGLLLFFFLMVRRREIKSHYEKTLLQERMQFDSEIATLSKQVAHDIRAPLSALVTVSQSRNSLNDSMKPLIAQASQRILGIAEDLLRLSRERQQLLGQGQKIPKKSNQNAAKILFSTVEIKDLFETVLREFQVRYPRIQFVQTYRLQNGSIAITSAQLSRAFSNLIQNSLDAVLANSSPTVSVSVSQDKETLKVQIQDNGKGMAPEVSEKILTEGGTFGKISGNGLGLQFVRQMIADCHGDIRVHSKINQGTVFSLSIPTTRDL